MQITYFNKTSIKFVLSCYFKQNPVAQTIAGGQLYYSIPMQDLVYAAPNQSPYAPGEGGDAALIEGLPGDMKHAAASVQPCFMGM